MKINSEIIGLQISCQKGKNVDIQVKDNAVPVEKDGITVKLSINKDGDCLLGEMELDIHTKTLEERFLLEMDRTVQVDLPLREKPESITAMYLFNPWWTRPAFVDSCAEIPDRTQIAFFRFADRAACCIPMAGDRFKTVLCGGTEDTMCLEMTAYKGGMSRIEEPIFLWSEAGTVHEAIHKAFEKLSRDRKILLRDQRRIPQMFRYLGWCSWDAFGTEVSQDGIRQKAAELMEKNVPVRWMLIDDGWMDSREKTVSGFRPDEKKFPGGFGPLTADLRSRDGIRWFGVWHALGGYWDGITPESALAMEERGSLMSTGEGLLVPDPRKGADFYHHWYRELRGEGIDFVKVDGQSSCPFYYENSIPVCEAAQGIHQALEGGASRMDGAVINCMGMAMENIMARPSTVVSRNSDDFLPENEDSFTEHLLQNAYNAMYHNEIYCCDWDMFWTNHVHAKKHALLRAISGGPVYVSDKTGMTVPEVLSPLIYTDGEILMMERSAKPTEDCLFSDPGREGVLKLHNIGNGGGGLAVLNLTDRMQRYSFTPDEIPDLRQAEEYWMYDYFNKAAYAVDAASEYEAEIAAGGIAWHVLVPKTGNCSCFGLLDKYAGFMAVENICEQKNTDVIILHETGITGWASDRECMEVSVNGVDVTNLIQKQGPMFTLPLPVKAEKAVLMIRWK